MSYIERESLIEKCHWVIRSDGTRVYVCHAEDIETAPAADVAPVRHGRWIWDTKGLYPKPLCSRCQYEPYRASNHSSDLPPYCPNCGAKMDLEEQT